MPRLRRWWPNVHAPSAPCDLFRERIRRRRLLILFQTIVITNYIIILKTIWRKRKYLFNFWIWKFLNRKCFWIWKLTQCQFQKYFFRHSNLHHKKQLFANRKPLFRSRNFNAKNIFLRFKIKTIFWNLYSPKTKFRFEKFHILKN